VFNNLQLHSLRNQIKNCLNLDKSNKSEDKLSFETKTKIKIACL
jgi:hypothetical protein